MHVPVHVKEKVEQTLRKCIKLAESHYGTKFKFPEVNYNLTGTVAGRAMTNTWTVDFNSVLLMENIETFIQRTVIHEMAHLIDFKLHPENFDGGITIGRNGRYRRGKRDVHGVTWQSIMRLLGADASRCHSYDVSNAKKNVTEHEWHCKTCNAVMKLGPKRHNNMMSGTRYWLRGCANHAGFQYVGSAGSNQMPLLKAANAAKPKPSLTLAARNAAGRGMKGKTSKLDTCRALFESELSREQNIHLFMKVGGCTTAGAATYYAKIKKEGK